MLKMRTQSREYKISRIEPLGGSSDWPNEISLTLNEIPPLKIPIIMGDGKTPDYWYPYWQAVNNNPTPGIKLKFKKNDNETWIHVSELKTTDIVRFHPSLFDFEFLDTASRRFEINYDKSGKRYEEKFTLPRPPRSCRPYHLGELDTIKGIWEILSNGLDKKQIYQLIGLIEEKRALWNLEKGDLTSEKFIEWALLNANWQKGKKPKKDSDILKGLISAAQSGLLADTAELYLEILKEDINNKEENND